MKKTAYMEVHQHNKTACQKSGQMVFFSQAVVSFCIELFCVVTLQYQILVRIAIAYFIIEKIITTRPTGGLHQGYKPLLLGQRLKALAFSLDCGNSVYTAFPQLRSSHIALDSSLPLKGYCYYLALTLKRVFIFLYTQLIHCYIMLFLLLDIFFYCSLI